MMPSERRVPAQAYVVRLYCDCGTEMEPTGQVLTTDPPQYPHHCSSCNRRTVQGKPFPYVDYEEETS